MLSATEVSVNSVFWEGTLTEGGNIMYMLIQKLGIREWLVRQSPVLVGALAIAEIFYKFGSFLLEAVAFLITWFFLDAITELVLHRKRRDDR
jgi:hypothetical protein